MSRKEMVAIGGSAGSYEALEKILSCLPANYKPAVALILHQHRHTIPPTGDALSGSCSLPIVTVVDKEPVRGGHIYLCPANYHLLVEPSRTFALSTDPPVNLTRPSIDVFFESAAQVYGEKLVALLLSGASADGANALTVVKREGGIVGCQDPTTAIEPAMPRAAYPKVDPEWVGSPEALGIKLCRL